MTQKDLLLRMVLDNKKLQETYNYDRDEYESLSDALLTSNSPIVVAVARIIKNLDEPSKQNSVYNDVFNYLNNHLLS